MKLIIGHTGLVGKTLTEYINFDYSFNTKNIHDFKNIATDGDDLYLCCLPASKWLVNSNIRQDIDNINSIIDLISNIKFNNIILVSTIDVYNESPLKFNEDDIPLISNLNYGSNRYLFELMVTNLIQYDSIKIFRLPALFNKHIKKNILFDLLTNHNIEHINTNSKYQWYNLDNLYFDMKYYINTYPNNSIFNLFTEPIDTKEILSLFPQYRIDNSNIPILYDYCTKFGSYIKDKNTVLNEIKQFINEFSIK